MVIKKKDLHFGIWFLIHAFHDLNFQFVVSVAIQWKRTEKKTVY